MQQYFYSHLIPFNDAEDLISSHNLSKEESEELYNLVHSIFHHRVLELILVLVPKKDHNKIIFMISNDPSDENILVLLKSLHSNIEEEIIKAGNSAYEEIRSLSL